MGRYAKDRHAKGKDGETGGIAGQIAALTVALIGERSEGRSGALRVVRGAGKAVWLSRSSSL
jgi:hypothetical protein